MTWLKVRPMRFADIGFVVAAWLKSYRKHSLLCDVDQKAYWRSQSELVKAIMAREGVVTLVLCDPDNESTLLGFATSGPSKGGGRDVYYVYVRVDFRKEGHAHALLAQTGDIDGFVFDTPSFRDRIKPDDRNWAHRPQLLF